MSFEPTIYASENNVSYQDLASTLSKKSWELVFLSASTSTVIDEAGIISDGYIYAWKSDSLSKDLVSSLLTNNNNKEIQNKLNEGVLATCELFIDNNYSINDEFEKDEIEELLKDMGKEYVDKLKEAKCSFTTRSNNSCGPLTGEFQDILCDVLVEMTDGFCDIE